LSALCSAANWRERQVIQSSLLQNKTLAYDFGSELYSESCAHFKYCSHNISIIFPVL
jgi:hypothetical protein